MSKAKVKSGAPILSVKVVKFDDRVEFQTEDGKLHHHSSPAIRWFNGDKEYYCLGLRHRTNGPAVIRADGTLEYYVNGLLNNVTGPAIRRADGTEEYYIAGEKLSTEEWEWQVFGNRKSVEPDVVVLNTKHIKQMIAVIRENMFASAVDTKTRGVLGNILGELNVFDRQVRGEFSNEGYRRKELDFKVRQIVQLYENDPVISAYLQREKEWQHRIHTLQQSTKDYLDSIKKSLDEG